jgi:hypothetical protein
MTKSRRMRDPSKYDEAFHARFAKLWADKTNSTNEIGRQLGISKNAVCGIRKRSDLEPRGSVLAGGRKKLIEAGVLPPREPSQKALRVAQAKTEAEALPPPMLGISQEDWLRWFNLQSFERRRAIAAATHTGDCPLTIGGPMWHCTCGLSLPRDAAPPSEPVEPPEPVVVPEIPAMAEAAAPAELEPPEASQPPVEPPEPVEPRQPPPPESTVPADPRPTPFPPARGLSGCRWPSTTERGVVFDCNEPTEPGRSYCLEHCQASYTGYKPASERSGASVVRISRLTSWALAVDT